LTRINTDFDRNIPPKGPLIGLSVQSCNFAHGRQRFGLRWQSAAATPLSALPVASKSGVALRFPPQSQNLRLRPKAALGESVFIRGKNSPATGRTLQRQERYTTPVEKAEKWTKEWTGK
jgi:hypothetical protein